MLSERLYEIFLNADDLGDRRATVSADKRQQTQTSANISFLTAAS